MRSSVSKQKLTRRRGQKQKHKRSTHRNRKMSGGGISGQHYLALDIETGGIDKPIFALGATVFRIEGGMPVFTGDEGMWNFAVPEVFDSEIYDEDTWKWFWGPSKPENFAVLQRMNAAPNCASEAELIQKFYAWWQTVTQKYDNIKIVTDEPTFDVGFTDAKIKEHVPGGLPLRKQKKGENKYYYTSTIDYNTFENLIDITFPMPPNDWSTNPELKKIWGEIPPEYKHDHDPLNDSKDMAYKFAKMWTFMQGRIGGGPAASGGSA